MRGTGLIINNYKFNDGTEFNSSGHEGQSLRAVLKGINFDVVSVENGTAAEMKVRVRDCISKSKTNSSDCLLIVISSHGLEHYFKQILIGVDLQRFDVKEDILNLFTTESEPQLKDCLKLVFIDACRGGK